MKRVPSLFQYKLSVWLGWIAFAFCIGSYAWTLCQALYTALTRRTATVSIHLENSSFTLQANPEHTDSVPVATLNTQINWVSTTFTDLKGNELVLYCVLTAVAVVSLILWIVFLGIWLLKISNDSAFTISSETALGLSFVFAVLGTVSGLGNNIVLLDSRNIALYQNVIGVFDSLPPLFFLAFPLAGGLLTAPFGILRNRGLDLEQDTEGLV